MKAVENSVIACFKANYCVAFGMLTHAMTEHGLRITEYLPEFGRVGSDWLQPSTGHCARFSAQFLDSEDFVAAVTFTGNFLDEPVSGSAVKEITTIVLKRFVELLNQLTVTRGVSPVFHASVSGRGIAFPFQAASPPLLKAILFS